MYVPNTTPEKKTRKHVSRFIHWYKLTSYSKMSMYTTSRKHLIFFDILMEQKKFRFDHVIDIRDEPGRLSSMHMTLLDGL